MAQRLTFYTNPNSRGRIVRWMLEEIGCPYETEVLDYGTGMKSPAYLAINPMGKVPAIRHGDNIVTECAAICCYLADKFPEENLAPPLGERADYYRWLFFAAGPVEAAVMNRHLGFEVSSEQERMVGYGHYRHVLDALELAVAGDEYIAGARFSAADVYVGSQIGWGLQFGTLEERPGFAAYWARISDRDAYRRANALDDALLPAG